MKKILISILYIGFVFAQPCDDTEFFITVDGGTYPEEVAWEIVDILGNVLISRDYEDIDTEEIDGGAPITIEDGLSVCLIDGSYGIGMYDSWGDGWNGNILQLWTLDSDGNYVEQFSATVETGNYAAGQLDVGDGPFDDLLGCTDPDAANTDPDAIWDDGSCQYGGDNCTNALTAFPGDNEANLAPMWFSFTANMTGSATVSSDGSGVDTQVYGYSGDCDNLIQVGFGDDEGADFSSIMSFEINAGENYYIHWTDYWSDQGFSWTLVEEGPETTPTNLTAAGGLGRVYLNWNPYNPENTGDGITGTVSVGDAALNIEEHVQMRADKFAASKLIYQNQSGWQGKTLEKVQDHVATLDLPQYRDTDIYITLYDSYGDGHDQDAYLMEVTAEGATADITFNNTGYDIVETLPGGWTGYESAYGPFTLEDGLYYVAWNPNGLETGATSDNYLNTYLTVPDLAGGYNDAEWTF